MLVKIYVWLCYDGSSWSSFVCQSNLFKKRSHCSCIHSLKHHTAQVFIYLRFILLLRSRSHMLDVEVNFLSSKIWFEDSWYPELHAYSLFYSVIKTCVTISASIQFHLNCIWFENNIWFDNGFTMIETIQFSNPPTCVLLDDRLGKLRLMISLTDQWLIN